MSGFEIRGLAPYVVVMADTPAGRGSGSRE
jgi:hypothetical protein